MIAKLLRSLRAPGKLVWFQAVLAALVAAVLLILRKSQAPWEGLIGKHMRLHKRLTTDEQLAIWLWWSAVWVLVILALLLLLSPLWTRWASGSRTKPDTWAGPKMTRGAWLWLLCGLLLATAIRVPRLGRNIERDEQDTVRRDIVGYLYLDDSGEHFADLPWRTTLWEDMQANNPFFFSVLARVSLRTWQLVTHAGRSRLSLPVLRLWAIVPGVLSLAALWWWLRLMGRPNAANLALFLGAIHPMHVNYSVQARGYALMMLFTTLALAVAWLALSRGLWRWWMALAACFFGALYSAPVSLYFTGILAATLSLVLVIRWLWRGDADARRSLVRFGVASLCAAALYLPLVLPAYPQAQHYVLHDLTGAPSERSGLAGPWPLNFWAEYSAGVFRPDMDETNDWDGQHMTAASYLLGRLLPQSPLVFILVWVIVPVLALLGMWSLGRNPKGGWLLLIAGIGAPLQAYVCQRIADIFFYYWYLIYFLPVLLALVAAGLDWLCQVLRSRRCGPLLAAAPVVVVFALFITVNSVGRDAYTWFPGTQTEPQEFDRGRNRWVTFPDGRTRREPLENPAAAPSSP